MPKYYVDSNVFFYAEIMDKRYGQSCSEIVRNIAAGRLDAAISSLIVLEVANTLRKYGWAKDVAPEVRAISTLGIETYQVDASDVRDAAEIFFEEEEAEINPYDCLHAAIMRRYEATRIISADREFEKLSWLRRIDPEKHAVSL
jgi:predicted nucleic acid-binding protein